jgi:CheY-like chemotaxis protein
LRTIASARSTISSEWPSRRNGLEDLGELRADPDLHTIPVVVLTTSEAEADILRSHKLPANADV